MVGVEGGTQILLEGHVMLACVEFAKWLAAGPVLQEVGGGKSRSLVEDSLLLRTSDVQKDLKCIIIVTLIYNYIKYILYIIYKYTIIYK